MVFFIAGIGWRWKWFSRPRQGTRMTVVDYYTKFCNWKEEMITSSFPAEEADYIDGFIENLSCDIGLRVSKWRLSINSLSDAFDNAKWAESMINLQRTLKEIKAIREVQQVKEQPVAEYETVIAVEDATQLGEMAVDYAEHKVFDKMPRPAPIHGKAYNILVVGACESEDKAYKVFDEMPLPLVEEGLNQDEFDHFGKAISSLGDESQVEALEEVAYQLFDKLTEPVSLPKSVQELTNSARDGTQLPEMDALKVLDNLTKPIQPEQAEVQQQLEDKISNKMKMQENYSYILGRQAVQNEGPKVFVEISGPFLKEKQLETEDSFYVSLLGDEVNPLLYAFGTRLADEHEKSHKSKLGIVQLWAGEVLMFVFDPGGRSWHRKGCGFTESNSVKQNFDKMPSNLSVELWFGKLLMLLFDPGGGYLPPTVCHVTVSDKYARNDQSSIPKNMCVCIVEWSTNEACKPLAQLMVDLLSWIQGALDSDDVGLVRMRSCYVLNTIQDGVVPNLVDVPSDFVINPVMTSLPTYQDFKIFGGCYVAADEIELLTCEAYDMEIAGIELCEFSLLHGKSSVRNIFNQFMLYMSWLFLIVVETGDELATEMFILNGVKWNLRIEQGWSVGKEALCSKDEKQLVATTKDMSVVSPGITTLFYLAETFGHLKLLNWFPTLWNLLWVLNHDFLGQKGSFKLDKDVEKIHLPCPQFIDSLTDKKGRAINTHIQVKAPK